MNTSREATFPFVISLDNFLDRSADIDKSNRLDALLSALNLLKSLEPIQLRIVGSTAFALMTENPLASLDTLPPTSDIDIHVIIKDLEQLTAAPLSLEVLSVGEFGTEADIIASKRMIYNYLVSIHFYSEETFERMCRLSEERFNMIRNTAKTQNFTYRGLHKTYHDHWQSMPLLDEFSVEIVQKPVLDEALYIYPYQHMAITGIDLIHSPTTQKFRVELLHNLIQQVKLEGCVNGQNFAAMFNHSKLESPPVLRAALTTYFNQTIRLQLE